MKIKISAKDEHMPKYQNPGDVGADLKSAEEETIIIPAGENKLIKTGVKIELPQDIMATVHPRSGLAKKGIIAITGIIDIGFRGEIKVNLANLSTNHVEINPGDRIAQMVFNPVVKPEFVQVDKLSETKRGEEGFGSTGLS
ncbi:dUTP diphosphatase [Natranaerobius thermophilus]|uniref:dUTP diphosphatase n=1 Tax=Natranaerobius thermophilus (strain ATCC BAA-1301 / DSM 18059 / JW/NM-WN-LF) TaxID=457570 RepID=B2A6K7_NATTJ|nr:dUTP diphosphatase [Natranaerobius thermophilus]ACB85540.1 deoxyuridine 5'-triphosphate nucleotidohydrolase Dut [Natranaerobius thermophilus JW/NM-WN-LF]